MGKIIWSKWGAKVIVDDEGLITADTPVSIEDGFDSEKDAIDFAESCGTIDNRDKEELPSWKIELAKVKKCPQRQDSLSDQLRDLYQIANKFGFYDAADYIKPIK